MFSEATLKAQIWLIPFLYQTSRQQQLFPARKMIGSCFYLNQLSIFTPCFSRSHDYLNFEGFFIYEERN